MQGDNAHHHEGREEHEVFGRICSQARGARPSRSPQSASRRLALNALGETPKAAGGDARAPQSFLKRFKK